MLNTVTHFTIERGLNVISHRGFYLIYNRGHGLTKKKKREAEIIASLFFLYSLCSF